MECIFAPFICVVSFYQLLMSLYPMFSFLIFLSQNCKFTFLVFCFIGLEIPYSNLSSFTHVWLTLCQKGCHITFFQRFFLTLFFIFLYIFYADGRKESQLLFLFWIVEVTDFSLWVVLSSSEIFLRFIGTHPQSRVGTFWFV